METHWQPIETAPKDGTVILLRQADDSLCGYAQRYWLVKRHAIGYYKDWWVIGVPGGHKEGGGDHQFTHWMPLHAIQNRAAQVSATATSGTRIAGVDSQDNELVESATSVKTPSARPAPPDQFLDDKGETDK